MWFVIVACLSLPAFIHEISDDYMIVSLVDTNLVYIC